MFDYTSIFFSTTTRWISKMLSSIFDKITSQILFYLPTIKTIDISCFPCLKYHNSQLLSSRAHIIICQQIVKCQRRISSSAAKSDREIQTLITWVRSHLSKLMFSPINHNMSDLNSFDILGCILWTKYIFSKSGTMMS